MTGRGGKRPGAGRKAFHLRPEAQSPILIAERKLSENLPDLVEIAIDMAKAGDRALLVYCIDRVMGKAVQPVDVYAAARQIAEQRGLDPAKVISIYDALKKRAV